MKVPGLWRSKEPKCHTHSSCSQKQASLKNKQSTWRGKSRKRERREKGISPVYCVIPSVLQPSYSSKMLQGRRNAPEQKMCPGAEDSEDRRVTCPSQWKFGRLYPQAFPQARESTEMGGRMGKGGSGIRGKEEARNKSRKADILWGSNPLGKSCWKTSAKGPGSGVQRVYRICSGQTSKASLSGGGWALLLSIWSGKGRGSQQCWGCWRSWVPKIKSCYSCADAALEAHSPSNPTWLNTFTQLAAHLLPLSPKSMPTFYTLPISPLEINLIFTSSTKIFKAKTHTHTHKNT